MIEPDVEAVNLTPRSSDEGSPESAADGTVKSKTVFCGAVALDAPEAGLVPTALVAVTLNV